ncbi:CPBP family intramembrane glutamic endopeptidase [Undibacterium terreum]|uniref:CAAX prenyl protease 2/Lysostaphin resistance protein A-like domain-containing protein n=1 Tax=Undibacterium terreum TaxID=1224302 RepID=A0A916U8J2_9BURK|nr:CPBP family intramembrane glutamic endopeptidase [Undibacterium terreum]GGC63416.1 hypothetical protein GCM10011396_07960 [Undibacterium terreum]
MELVISQGAQQHRWTRYLMIGLAVGVLDLVITSGLYPLLMLLPANLLGESAAAGILTKSEAPFSTSILFINLVVLMPLFETTLAQSLPIELARKLGASKNICIFLSAFIFGLGHFLNGGLGHGLLTFCAGLILAYFYLKVREDGPGASYWVTAIAHATNNLVMCILFTWFPSLA